MRPQVIWPDQPAKQTVNQALAFNYVPGSAVSARWQKKGGTGGLKVWNNSAFGLPNALGIDNEFFANAAALWDTPFANDSVKTVVKTVNGGPGKSSVIVCSDINMTSYLAVQFETGSSNNRLHILAGTGPVTMVEQRAPVTNTVANLDVYSIIYDDTTKTLSVFKGRLAHATDQLDRQRPRRAVRPWLPVRRRQLRRVPAAARRSIRHLGHEGQLARAAPGGHSRPRLGRGRLLS